MRTRKRLTPLLLMCLLAAFFVSTANALEYDFDPPDDYLFGKSTSQDVIYTEEEDINVNRSKTAALVPPGFGTPTSYLPGSGEYLTPNLAPGAMNGGLVNSVNGMDYTSLPSTDGSGNSSFAPSTSIFGDSISGSSEVTVTTTSAWQDGGNAGYTRYTDVTSDLYYSDGSLGKLQIPSLGVNARIVQGTDKAALAKGIGHFEDTSIWNGNVCLASHNRGSSTYFSKIHTLNEGDTIILTTQLGTRTYYVTNIKKVSETDNSDTAATAGNQITLYTCVQNESEYRWCVTGVELV